MAESAATAWRDRLTGLSRPLLIAIAAALAYSNSLHGEFIFDDLGSIVDNPVIRSLQPLWKFPGGPSGTTVAGRPIVALSLALNYAFGGLEVWSYHLLNLAVHVCAALALFGIVRRTLLLPTLSGQFGPVSSRIALSAALIWVVHPLQTSAVTYVIQRCESLMGLFFLLTLYFAIRGWTSRRAWAWQMAAVASCALGTGCKEVIVAAPLLVWLYDWLFVSGSCRAALRRSWPFYLGLGLALLMLLNLVATGATAAGANYAILTTTPWQYASTQFGVILHYLRLSLWPAPLCLDYGWPLARHAGDIVVPALVIGAALLASVWALYRRAAFGFVGAWFFLILAPTSSVIPLSDCAVEYRMYLPLAAPAVLVALGLEAATGYLARRFHAGRELARRALLALVLALFGCLTFERNAVYGTGELIWADTIAQRPENHRARNNFGVYLEQSGRFVEAVAQYKEALKTSPDLGGLYANLGRAFARQRKFAEATAWYQQAVACKPGDAENYSALGNIWFEQGRMAEALASYRKALELSQESATAHNNLAVALTELGATDEALKHCAEAARLKPDDPSVAYNMGNAWLKQGDPAAALDCYRSALRLRPNWPRPLERLAWVLATSEGAAIRNGAEAVRCAEAACKLTSPRPARFLDTLAASYAEAGRFEEAEQAAKKALEQCRAAGQQSAEAALQARLEQYRRRQPFHEQKRTNGQ